MRTEAEIVEHTRAVESEDSLGFRREVLVGYLSFEAAKPWLDPSVQASAWTTEANDVASIRTAAREYLEFAWTKARDHRGISANRSCAKLAEFIWLLGDDAAYADVERLAANNFAQYGCPVLAFVAVVLDAPVPDDESIQRMIRGQPCRPDCVRGCGLGFPFVG